MRYTVVLLIYFLNSCLVYGDIATDNYDDWNQGVNSYFNPGNRRVLYASARSFQDLGNGYGKDSFRVFYRGKLSSTSGPRLRRLRRKPRKLENVAQERLLLQTWIRSLREMH